MKKILLGLLVLFSFLQGFSQAGNDSTKYSYYKNQYGFRLPRLQADSVLMPPKDTLTSKYGIAIKIGVLYFGNGTKWTAVGASTSTFYDSTLMASVKRLKDSSFNKIRFLIRRSDSVFAAVGTSLVFQYKDSVGSGGGGSPNTSVGGGYRLIVVGTNQVKTLTAGAFIKFDTTISGEIRIIVDSAGVVTWLNTYHPLKQVVDSSMIVHAGVGGAPDTSGVKYPVYYINDSTFSIAGHILHITSGGGGTGPVSFYFDAATLAGDPGNPLNPLHVKPTTVTPGSYTNISGTIDSTGRFTAASNGTGGGITALTGDVTAIGTGSVAATISGLDAVKIGGGAVSNTEYSYLDGLSSPIQTQLNGKQATLVSGTNIKTVGGVSILGSGDIPVSSSGYTQAQIDSMNTKVTVSNTSQYFRPYGTSYLSGQGASPQSYNMVHIVAGKLGKILDSTGPVGGTGGVQAVISMNRNTASYNSQDVVWIDYHFNDLRRGGNAYRTFRKVQNNAATFITNHFLGFAVAGSNSAITKTGTWPGQDISALGAKAGNDILTGTSIYAQSSGATLTWVTPIATNNIVWGEYVIDSVLATGGTYTISIDGTLQTNPQTGTTTWSQNAQTDGISDGFQANQQMPNSHTIFTPDYKVHTVVLTTTSANTVYLDFFGYLMPFQNGAAIFIDKAPKMWPLSYSITPGNGSDAIFNSGDSLIGVAAAPFLARNYPVSLVDVNKFFVPIKGVNLDFDTIHPNNLGHAQIAAALFDRINWKDKSAWYVDNSGLIQMPFQFGKNVKFGIVAPDVFHDYINAGSDILGNGTFNIITPGGVTNGKLKNFYVGTDGSLNLRAVSDNNLAAKTMMAWYGTSSAIDSIASETNLFTIPNAILKTKNVDFVSAQPATQTKAINMGIAAGTIPFIDMFNSGAAANTGRWNLYADGTNLNLRALNDLNTGANSVYIINRTGTTVNYFQHDSKLRLAVIDSVGAATGGFLFRDFATGETKLIAAPSSTATWGGITGTLSSQSDLNTALGLKAPLASPALTGTPTVPTASAGTNTTQIASTAYVDRAAGFITNVVVSGTNTLSQYKTNLIELNPSSLQTTLTINFPASPNEGDGVILNVGGTIGVGSPVVTTLTISGNGHTLYGTAFPTAVVGGDAGFWIYHSNVGWFRQKY